MARYYVVIIVMNLLFAALFYFKEKNAGLSLKPLVLIGALSTGNGILFPEVVGYFNIYGAIGINLCVVCLGTYYIARMKPPQTDKLLEPNHEEGKKIEDIVITVTGAECESEAEAEMPFIQEIQITETEPDLDKKLLSGFEDDKQDDMQDDNHKDNQDGYPEVQDERLMAEKIDINVEEGLSPQQGEAAMNAENPKEEEIAELRDSYITRGFNAKGNGRLDLAAKYFSSALELDPPTDLSTMLVMDIYAMLRELGRYNRAKECLEQFLRKHQAKLSPQVVDEIKTSLKYLEILQNLLQQVKTPTIPFSKVPALIKVSVEEKINQWKNEG